MIIYALLKRLRSWLWGLMHDRRWWKVTVVSTIMWAIGWWLVYVWATHLGQDAVLGRNLISCGMVPVTFVIHRTLIWPDRPCNPRKIKLRWSWTWIKLHCLNVAIYWLAVNAAGLQYLEAGMAMTIPMALLGYYYRDKRDFVPDMSQTLVSDARAEIELARAPRML